MAGHRKTLLATMLLGMHACWFYAWARMLESAASAPVPVGQGVVLILAIAVAWRLLLRRIALRQIVTTVLYWLAWPVIASLVAKALLFAGEPWRHTDWLLALPGAPLSLFFEPQVSELILFVGSAGAWYFGQRLVFREPEYGRLLADFQFGLVMLLVAFLVGYGFGVEAGHPLLLTIAFFGLGLSAVATARSAGDNNGTEGLSRGQLSGAVLGLIAAVFFTALLVAAIVRPETIDAVLAGIRYVGGLIVRLIAWMASWIPTPDYATGDTPAPATGDDSGLIEWYRSLPLPAILRRTMFVIWTTVVLGVLIAALWRVCQQVLEWLRRRRTTAPGAVVESTGRGLWSDIRALASWLLRVGKRLVARLRTRLIHGDAPDRTAGSVYLALVRWAGKKLVRREPWQSPYEYLASLLPLVPAAADDLSFVTDGYVDERYGGHTAGETAIAELAAAAARIRRARRSRDSNHARGDVE
jgi:hypothetical protein